MQLDWEYEIFNFIFNIKRYDGFTSDSLIIEFIQMIWSSEWKGKFMAKRVLFIGAGNMGFAILRSFINGEFEDIDDENDRKF